MESCLFSMDVKQEHNSISGNNGETNGEKRCGRQVDPKNEMNNCFWGLRYMLILYIDNKLTIRSSPASHVL